MQPLFDTCAELFKAHRYTECIRRLSELVRTAQTADELLVAARVAYVALFRGLEMRLLRRAARLAPRDPKVVLYQCATYLERGRFLEAEELLTPWLEADSWTAEELARARAYLAVSYAGRRRFRTAGQALERAAAMAAIAGADAQRLVEYVRLSILIYEGRWEEGIQGLNTYIAAHPDEHRAYILLATCCEHLGEADAVLRTLRAACDRFPEHPELHIRLSTAAWAAGQTVLAQDALDRAGALLTGRRAERIVRHMRAMLHEPGRRLPVPPIRQGHDLCFPACLAMLLAYCGQPADQRAIGAAVMKRTAARRSSGSSATWRSAGGWCAPSGQRPSGCGSWSTWGCRPSSGSNGPGGARPHLRRLRRRVALHPGSRLLPAAPPAAGGLRPRPRPLRLLGAGLRSRGIGQPGGRAAAGGRRRHPPDAGLLGTHRRGPARRGQGAVCRDRAGRLDRRLRLLPPAGLAAPGDPGGRAGGRKLAAGAVPRPPADPAGGRTPPDAARPGGPCRGAGARARREAAVPGPDHPGRCRPPRLPGGGPPALPEGGY